MAENVFGIPMNVQSHQDAIAEAASDPDRVTWYLVMRCVDAPANSLPPPLRARNIIVACQNCRQSCWMDPKNAIPHAVVRCSHCVPEGELDLYAIREAVDEVHGHYPGLL